MGIRHPATKLRRRASRRDAPLSLLRSSLHRVSLKAGLFYGTKCHKCPISGERALSMLCDVIARDATGLELLPHKPAYMSVGSDCCYNSAYGRIKSIVVWTCYRSDLVWGKSYTEEPSYAERTILSLRNSRIIPTFDPVEWEPIRD